MYLNGDTNHNLRAMHTNTITQSNGKFAKSLTTEFKYTFYGIFIHQECLFNEHKL